MSDVKGYAASSELSGLAPFTFSRRKPRPDDVCIDIEYCGVCHTDIHFAENDWGRTRSFDFLLDTIPVQHDLNPYLGTLTVAGTHILVGMIEPIEPAVHSRNLIGKRRVLTGSLIGGMPETQEVLDFCAEHDIQCDIEMLDISNINEAYKRMKEGDVKYRFVIDMQSLKN